MDIHDNTEWTPLRNQVSPKELEHSLCILNEKYTFNSLSQATKILNGKAPPVKNGLVLTLDDGYLNNLTYGGPLFKKVGIQPCLFISTEHTEHCREFWVDRLDYAIQQISATDYSVDIMAKSFTFNCSCRQQLKQSYTDFRRIVKNEFSSDQDMRDYLEIITSEIEKHTGKSLNDIIHKDDWCGLASWTQLAEVIKDSSFEIGCHTLDHIRIALVDEETVISQVTRSKKIIEKKLAIACDTFCYPDNSYNSTAIAMLKAQQYQCATTTDIGLNNIGCNMMTLKRFNLPTHQDPKKLLYSISALRHIKRIILHS